MAEYILYFCKDYLGNEIVHKFYHTSYITHDFHQLGVFHLYLPTLLHYLFLLILILTKKMRREINRSKSRLIFMVPFIMTSVLNNEPCLFSVCWENCYSYLNVPPMIDGCCLHARTLTNVQTNTKQVRRVSRLIYLYDGIYT